MYLRRQRRVRNEENVVVTGEGLSQEYLDHIRLEYQKYKIKQGPRGPVVLFSEFKAQYLAQRKDSAEAMVQLSKDIMKNPPNLAL